MTSKQNRPNFGAAAVIGITTGAMSIYFLSQCPSSEPRRGYQVQSQQSYDSSIHHEAAMIQLPYNTKRQVGGLELEFIRKDYGAEARVRYETGGARIDTGMKLKSGATSTLPINGTDMQVRITANSMDEQKLNISVNVEARKH